MIGRMEIVKEFCFEAAHFLPTAPEGHRNRRLHGHSFKVKVAIRGVPHETHGWITDFATFESELRTIWSTVDHQTLNEIEGLSVPTLENIALWMARKLSGRLSGLARITVQRESCGEACVYELEGGTILDNTTPKVPNRL